MNQEMAMMKKLAIQTINLTAKNNGEIKQKPAVTTEPFFSLLFSNQFLVILIFSEVQI